MIKTFKPTLLGNCESHQIFLFDMLKTSHPTSFGKVEACLDLNTFNPHIRFMDISGLLASIWAERSVDDDFVSEEPCTGARVLLGL